MVVTLLPLPSNNGKHNRVSETQKIKNVFLLLLSLFFHSRSLGIFDVHLVNLRDLKIVSLGAGEAAWRLRASKAVQ